MNKKLNFIFLMIFVLFLSSAAVLASGGEETAVVSAQVDLGAPGTVFRFEQTFGENGVPYLADSGHLYLPVGIGTDGVDNLWVAEEWGARVLQYSGDGSFLMSIGTAGLSYLADETHFATPNDIVVDSAGNFWVADPASTRVVKFDQDGNFLMQLGVTWESGDDNDHFSTPAGLAIDSGDNLYVSEYGNHRIQVFDSSGVYSTTIGQTGNPGTGNDQFQNPIRITIDDADNLYVADAQNHRVQIFDASHTYVATLGDPGVSGSDNGHFDWPRGVAVDASYIYVADSNNHRVQVFDRAAPYSYQDTLGWGSGNYAFNLPCDVAVDSAGNLYVADTLNHRVQKYNSSLAYVRTFGVTGVPYLTDDYHYNQPNKVAVDANGNIAILEDEGRGHRLILLDASGVPQFSIGEAGVLGWDNEHFNDARGVTFDAEGNIYVGDCANHRVQIFTSAGVYSSTLGSSGQENDQFSCPAGVTFDGSGNLFVADSGNQRVQKFDSNLNYVATLGETGVSGDDNDHFNNPSDVAVDMSGNIFVVDTYNERVQKFDSSLTWQMTLGVTGECGGDFDHFCTPFGLAVDGDGNIYVAEYWNPRVQVFDSSGAYLTTIGGAWGDLSSQFRHLLGVAVDSAGNVYIPDLLNHRIQKFAPGVPNWQQVNINGFGEPENRGVFALAPFDGQLYAGTYNLSGSGTQLWRAEDGLTWTSVITDGFGYAYNTGVDHLLTFNNNLYVGTIADEVNGGEVWRSENGLDWSRVVSQGFSDQTNAEVSRFAVFNDQLYASTWSYTNTHGLEMWRSGTGDAGDWTRVVENGFDGDVNNATALSLEVFNSYLYAGTWNTTTGGEVWRSSNGAAWAQVNVDGFGTTNNRGVSALANFKGYLYAATRGTPDVIGDEVWRCQLCDSTDWTKVVDNGFGNAETNSSAALEVFNGYLYLVIGNVLTGLEVWRTPDGTEWQQIGFGGFGDNNNRQSYWDSSLSIFDGHLFIGTSNNANGGEIWRYDLEEQEIFLPMIQR